MRIVYVGNYSATDARGISYNTEEHVARSFEALGHTVYRVPERKVKSAGQLQNLTGLVELPDLILYTRTVGLGSWALDLWEWMAHRGVPTASYHLDIFWGLDRVGEIELEPMFRTAHVFTADGDHEEEFKLAGVNHHWLPAGVVADECVPGRPDRERWPFDVCFIGSGPSYGHAEYPFRREIVPYLRDRFGDRFAHVGGDGEVQRPGGGSIRGRELNDLLATVPVVCGDSCFADTSVRYSSDRPYELAGRGGFLVYPRIPYLAEEFGRNVPSVWWYNPADVDALGEATDAALEVALSKPAEVSDWKREGMQWIRENVSYTQRMASLLDTVGLA